GASADFTNGCPSTARVRSRPRSRLTRRRDSTHRGIFSMSDQAEPRAPQSPPAEAGDGPATPRPKRRRGSRGGRNRTRNRSTAARETTDDDGVELPERPSEGRPTVEAAERALLRKPQIGHSRPAPADAAAEPAG